MPRKASSVLILPRVGDFAPAWGGKEGEMCVC